MNRLPIRVFAALLAVAAAVYVGSNNAVARPPRQAATGAVSATVPLIKHVFVINIENTGYAHTWGPNSKAPYLARTLRGHGVLLTNYYATAHHSLPNYVAQISGQGPDPQTQSDCGIYSTFVRTGTAALGQAVGHGCVFPTSVPSLPGQMQVHGLTWKGYMQDMGTPCRHPAIGAVDPTQHAHVGDQYATRHNPFMYFAAITHAASCVKHVVGLGQLTTDLASTSTTPNLSYITPDLCSDGHDSPCVDGSPGGLISVNTWMRTWVPRIMSSPAYKRNGVLIITSDESGSPSSDSRACCGEGPAPNAPLPGIVGLGGGRVGALVLSRFVKPGTSSATSYNHYSLLASIEDIFGLSHLGYAGRQGLHRFGLDVYNSGWN